MLVLDVTSPDLPTARLEHKAHLTLNDFDRIVLQEVRAGWASSMHPPAGWSSKCSRGYCSGVLLRLSVNQRANQPVV